MERPNALQRLSAVVDRRVPALGRARARIRRHPWLRRTLAAVAALAAVGLVGFAVLWWTVDLPPEPPKPQAALVVAADGQQELAAFAPEGLRISVRLDQVAPIMTKALISAEDRRFYSHGGFDPIGIARALWKDVHGGREGGSTLTQQLVKVDYLTRERTISRKVKEAILSVKLEQTADKDEILERYLNTVYFGRNAYGIEAAARAYFDTSASKLTAPQAALLAGLVRSPESADPTEQPDRARERRAIVLRAMAQEKVLTPAQAREAEASDLGAIPPDRREVEAKLAPHFVDLVRQEAEKAVGRRALNTAGLKIVTTIDADAQRAAEAAIAQLLPNKDDPQAALVAVDQDGDVRAYVGGRDHAALKVDLARGKDGGGSGRQPGSTFKPFVLAAALGNKMTLGQRFPAPAHVDLQVDGQPWSVDNYGNESFGDLDLAEATAKSVNTVYARLLERVGPKAVVDTAHWSGITSDLKAVPSIALGAAEVSPLELARAYSTFANDGNRLTLRTIDHIEDHDGRTIWEPKQDGPERALPAEVARGVTYALRGVVDHGTGRAAKLDRPVAGKTGTTQNNVDAWFAGYVPGYTAVVWMGNPDGAIPMPATGGRAVTGGGLPARIWQRFMSTAVAKRPKDDFPAPPQELLKAPPPPSLSAQPASVAPGGTVKLAGDGFESCTAGWWVQLDGTFLASAPTTGADGHREASLQLPPDTPPGSYTVTAVCDDGTGARPVASTTIMVTGGDASTTTTSTTQPQETTTTTTAQRETTTTSTPTDATTSTSSPRRGGQG